MADYSVKKETALTLFNTIDPEQVIITKSGFDGKYIVVIEDAVYGLEQPQLLTKGEICDKYKLDENIDFFN